MDIKKSSFIFIILFSNTVFAEDCKTRFSKLDTQLHQILSENKIKKLIALEDALFKAIDKCRTTSGMFVLMGEVQIDMGQIPLAVVYGQKAIELDSTNWRAHNLLGSARILNKEPITGLVSLKKAVNLAPNNVNAKLNLASGLIENTKFDEALEIINKIIARNTDTDLLATAYYLRSQIYKGKGLIIEADKDLKEAKQRGFE